MSAEPSAVETLDLAAYLRDTGHIDLPPTERLRVLRRRGRAAHERRADQAAGLARPRADLRAAGRALDPGDAGGSRLSRAITAEECAAFTRGRPEVQRRMVLAGRAGGGAPRPLAPA